MRWNGRGNIWEACWEKSLKNLTCVSSEVSEDISRVCQCQTSIKSQSQTLNSSRRRWSEMLYTVDSFYSSVLVLCVSCDNRVCVWSFRRNIWNSIFCICSRTHYNTPAGNACKINKTLLTPTLCLATAQHIQTQLQRHMMLNCTEHAGKPDLITHSVPSLQEHYSS